MRRFAAAASVQDKSGTKCGQPDTSRQLTGTGPQVGGLALRKLSLISSFILISESRSPYVDNTQTHGCEHEYFHPTQGSFRNAADFMKEG